MDLTRLGHACVRLDAPHGRLVIDPGGYSDPDATDGADVVLITHEHADHVVPEPLRAALAERPALEVWAPPSVAAMLRAGAPAGADRVHDARAGDRFTVAGFAIEVFGELHAVVHPDVPRVANVAYLVGGAVLHPGDSFTLPGRPIDVLLLPVAGPWMRLAEAVDYVRAVGPRIAIPIHDAVLSPVGLALVDRLLGPQGLGAGGAEYLRLVDGEPVSLA